MKYDLFSKYKNKDEFINDPIYHDYFSKSQNLKIFPYYENRTSLYQVFYHTIFGLFIDS